MVLGRTAYFSLAICTAIMKISLDSLPFPYVSVHMPSYMLHSSRDQHTAQVQPFYCGQIGARYATYDAGPRNAGNGSASKDFMSCSMTSRRRDVKTSLVFLPWLQRM